MRTFFVTRHAGAIEWAKQNGFKDAEMVSHFNPADVKAGDKVLGTLPVHLASQVCSKGGSYHHLVLNLPPDARGKELTAGDMTNYGATLQAFSIQPL